MDFITVNTSMKYTVCTTFNADGYNSYGRRMIDTFLQTWPKEVELQVYAEACAVTQSAANLHVIDLEQASAELRAFKQQWRNVPRANGDISADPVRSRRRDAAKPFKWDAVRFAHKVYSIFHCAKNATTDVLIWMDADTICHSPVTMQDIKRLIPADKDLCFLGRKGKFSECGLYAMNLRSVAVQDFLKRFQLMYDDAEHGIFQQDEWHDSFIFDVVRRHTVLNELDWSSHLITGEGHPLINSDWGAYLDHLKGSRKKTGRSLATDLKVKRTESYWQ
jgi:hypothetical protein